MLGMRLECESDPPFCRAHGVSLKTGRVRTFPLSLNAGFVTRSRGDRGAVATWKALSIVNSRHLARLRHGYRGDVADAPKVITAEELDSMSPDERAQVVREHIVTDLNELPDGFRQRVEATATRLAEQLRPATG